MADLICKYCGRKVPCGCNCTHSPTKKHIAITDGQHCVYCGSKFIAGCACCQSPTKRHKLDE